MSIVENIKLLCTKSDLSIPRLEKILGLSNGSIYNWDKNSPSVDKLTKVANYFNVSLDTILERDTQSSITIPMEYNNLDASERAELNTYIENVINAYIAARNRKNDTEKE